ncbi:MAG: Type II secretory pathway protein LspG [Microgenomates group bacterium GW2011_GWC2_46_7]|nr:MAG: Type II secretory pathway protein LspG [Microgenomates group bacterium GW2011_GWC2_46_7]
MKKAFSLIELLVVIAIIGIMLAIGTISYLTAQKQVRDSRRKSDLMEIRQALETYRSENGVYPNADGANQPTGIVPNYITTLPTDPKTGTYFYSPNVPNHTYALCATLEIVPATPVTGCTTGNNYKVVNP